MGMKSRLYTMLRVRSDYGLSYTEKLLWWMVEDTSHEEYIRNLIELRDSGHIYEENDGKPVYYRLHYLTEKGYDYLPKVKQLYLKELWLKHRMKVLIAVLCSLGALLKDWLLSLLQ